MDSLNPSGCLDFHLESDAVGLVRLLDASLNRASEGLRVVEDYARFVLDDGHLTRLAKELRHGLAAEAARLPLGDRLACRETQRDVGTTVGTPSESERTDSWGVCLASLHRTHEALRSLEEHAKPIDPALGTEFERLRYASYTLAKGLGAVRRGNDRLGDARLCVLVDGHESLGAFARMAAGLFDAGVDVIQLRDKRLDDRPLLAYARELTRLAREAGAVAIVNDRADLAMAAGADGVHLGQEDLLVHEARRIVGPEAILGVSTHGLDQARRAVLDGADYVGCGPTFPSRTKQFDAFPGLDYLRQVSEEIALPSFGIGGIGPENVSRVLATGVKRVAVGSAVTAAEDPLAAARELKRMLSAA